MKTQLLKMLLVGGLFNGLSALAEPFEIANPTVSQGEGVEATQKNPDGKRELWDVCKKPPVLGWDGAVEVLMGRLMEKNLTEAEEKAIANATLEVLYVALRSENTPNRDKEAISELVRGVKGVREAETPDQRVNAMKQMVATYKDWQNGNFKKPEKKIFGNAKLKEFVKDVSRILKLKEQGFTVELNWEGVEEMLPLIDEYYPKFSEELRNSAPRVAPSTGSL